LYLHEVVAGEVRVVSDESPDTSRRFGWVLVAASAILVLAGSFSPWLIGVFAAWAIASWLYFGDLRRRTG